MGIPSQCQVSTYGQGGNEVHGVCRRLLLNTKTTIVSRYILWYIHDQHLIYKLSCPRCQQPGSQHWPTPNLQPGRAVRARVRNAQLAERDVALRQSVAPYRVVPPRPEHIRVAATGHRPHRIDGDRKEHEHHVVRSLRRAHQARRTDETPGL